LSEVLTKGIIFKGLKRSVSAASIVDEVM
jgi:hypothetical protein